MSARTDDPMAPLARALVARIAHDPELAAALREALGGRDPGAELVDQNGLPETVSRRAYLGACGRGEVPGARKRGRLWVARRDAVVAWWTGRAPSPAAGPEAEPEVDPAVAALRAVGYVVDEDLARRVLGGR